MAGDMQMRCKNSIMLTHAKESQKLLRCGVLAAQWRK